MAEDGGFGSIDTSHCTEVGPDCPVVATLYGDYFSTPACALFVGIYGVCLLGQLGFGWRSKTWSYTTYLVVGSIFELIGYISRVRMFLNPFVENGFILQILFLILAPMLIAAAISLTFKHVVLYYGAQYSLIRPRLYPWVFVGSDFVSIVIQAIGGAIAASSTSGDSQDLDKMELGNNVLIAGVSFQVVNMVVCGGLMLAYVWRYREGGRDDISASAAPHRTERSGKRTVQFTYSIIIAYVAIIIRCIYRIPEMAAGWGSDIMRNETTFMIFDGAMIIIAVILLTVVHPLWYFPFLSNKSLGFTSSKKKLENGQAESYQQLYVKDSA